MAGGFACNDWRIQFSGEGFDLVDILANHQDLILVVFSDELFCQRDFGRILRGDPEFTAAPGNGVVQSQMLRQREADLTAFRCGYPAPGLQITPGHVEAFRANETEDVRFETVFPYQRGGEAQPASRLEFGGKAEDGRGQQMNFVVQDNSPVALVEDGEVWKCIALFLSIGEDIVRSDGDGPNFFDFP